MSEHWVTVRNGKVVGFQCEDPEGPCHTYPGCECEEWSADHGETRGEGHGKVHHDDCWMRWWFDNPETTYYDGDDGVLDEYGTKEIPGGLYRSGYIEVEFDECVIWRFKEGSAW